MQRKAESRKPGAVRRYNMLRANAPSNGGEELQLPTPLGGVNRMVMPKHIALPPISTDGELLFETLVFVYVTMALGLQYLNLYRTVWWLPHSHNRFTINFYLVDLHLTAFIIIILGRRLFSCILATVVHYVLSCAMKKYVMPFVQKALWASMGATLLWLIWCIAWKHPIVKMLYLLYPICMYVMLFRTDIGSFFQLVPPSNQKFSKSVNGTKAKILVICTAEVHHMCSQSPEAVRNEVEYLKTDFNCRLKQVLINSLLSTYYVGFIPCCFAQSVLYYDTHWMTQQMICLWLSCFTMYVLQLYPPQYCNVLHSSALHLGRWHKVEGPAAHMPHTSWSETILWQQGALVKHRKELFRAEGITNAAEPGNATHSRFYVFFKDPSSILCGLVGLQITLLISQIGLLIFTKDWNYIISHSLLISSNYYVLFKLVRDFLVSGKIYKMEDILQHKLTS